MQITHLSPFGVEVSGLDDLSAASAEQIAAMVAAMQSDAGCGVLVVRGQMTTGDLVASPPCGNRRVNLITTMAWGA